MIEKALVFFSVTFLIVSGILVFLLALLNEPLVALGAGGIVLLIERFLRNRAERRF